MNNKGTVELSWETTIFIIIGITFLIIGLSFVKNSFEERISEIPLCGIFLAGEENFEGRFETEEKCVELLNKCESMGCLILEEGDPITCWCDL